MQRREDGKFDVVCRDLKRVVATPEEIMAGKVCAPSQPELFLENGNYKRTSGDSAYCDQQVKANYTQNTLTSLDIRYLSPCGNTTESYPCKGNVCTLPNNAARVLILTRTTYDFKNTYNESAIFTKQ